MPDEKQSLYFGIFNEIAILAQLSRTMFEARLPEGMLVSHFAVLNHLIRVADGRTPLQLARAFQVPKTTMTHTLGGLEKRGLIELRAHPRDGRSKCVWLTGAGRKFRDDAIAALGPDMEAVAEHLSEAEARDLLPRLADLRAFLDARRDGEDQALWAPAESAET